MKVQIFKIEQVKPYDRNPRLNDASVDDVAASIKQFGFRQPIVIDADGVIIAGHTRHKAALKLGLKQIPVHVATDLTPEQIKAYRIADNRAGEKSEWDYSILPIELSELAETGFDVDSIGFTLKDISLMDDGELVEGLTDPDDVPAPPDAAITQPGDLWLLGNHRLLCGNSCSTADLDRLLGGQTIHLVNMDPPYNVKVEPRSNNACAAGLSSYGETNTNPANHHQSMDDAIHGKRKATHKKLRAKDRPLMNDFVGESDFSQMLLDWFGNASRVLMPGGTFYIWGGYANLENYPIALKASGLYFAQGIVWDKMHPVMTRKDFLGGYELAFYGWKEGAGHRYFGDHTERDIWHVKKIPPQTMEHLTQKPVELAVKSIQLSSQIGENVLDLFGGSGSTLLGCEQTKRNGFLMELDPLYCDVIVDRFQRFTGQPGVLERTGKSPIPMGERNKQLK